MRCLVPRSSRLDDDEEMKHCCNVPSARAYAPTIGASAGSAVLGEDSGHDPEQGSLLTVLGAASLEREDDLALAAEAVVRASGR